MQQTMEQVTITEYPLTPVSGWDDPVPSVWMWDGEILEVLSWIQGAARRYHAGLEAKFGVEDWKRGKRVMVSIGWATGDRKVPNRWSWIGTTYGFDAEEFEQQLRPLLDRVRAAWGS